jgi:hypothetical protein
LRVEVEKKSRTAWSSQLGELVTSTTTSAPASTSLSPSPVSVFTPVCGEAATASWPCSVSRVTTFEPICPVPPMITIFMEAQTGVRVRA